TWVQTYGGSLALFIGLVVFATLVAYTQHAAKLRIDRWLLYTPIIGASITASSMAQTGWTLSMLLRSGLTALDSLRINRDVTKNAHFQACFDEASDRLLSGQSLTDALNQPALPMMVRHLVSIGERSGELEQVMEELGRFYTDEMSARIKAMTAMIEPMLTVFIGGMVGFVYLAFFSAVMAVSTGGR
ncbi:MAG: type II secretion system F family protein, partial [Cellvibrionaceae bacterium]|nr:type II secretion system F family protein [Cellvibrionaceae bacterium]